MAFELINSRGEGRYRRGLAAACPAEDEHRGELGSPSEVLIATSTSLAYLESGGTCPSPECTDAAARGTIGRWRVRSSVKWPHRSRIPKSSPRSSPRRCIPRPPIGATRGSYFLLVDRFNNPNAPPNFPYDRLETRYQGGRLRGIQDQIPYLKDLGVGALWLSPVLKNPPGFPYFWGGYLIQDFLRVEPRFCRDPDAALTDPTIGDAELRQLVDEAHRHGLYVILDIVLNHVGNLFTYKNLPDEPGWSSEPYAIAWRDADQLPNPNWDDILQVPAALADAGVWPKELRQNDYFRRRGGGDSSPAYQGDFGGGLRELVTEYVKLPEGTFPVRDHLIRCYRYLIGKFDIDGYRIDTLQ